MEIVRALITNKVLVCAAISWFIAQASKNIIETIKYGFSAKRLTGGGAMPSTHTSVVVSLATGAFMVDGPGSTVFALAVFVAFIVVYDAMGVRRTTGLQSRILNRIARPQMPAVDKPQCPDNQEKPAGTLPAGEKLEENMGHTLTECIVGGVIGLVTTIITGQLL